VKPRTRSAAIPVKARHAARFDTGMPSATRTVAAMSPVAASVLSLTFAAALAMLAGCNAPLEGDAIYAFKGDHPLVCGLNIDHGERHARDLEPALDRALGEGSIVQFYTHAPSPDGPVFSSRVEGLITAAAARGMDFVTYREMADDTAAGSSVALSFDDTFVDQWEALRPVFRRYGVRATFFVSQFHDFDAGRLDGLARLAADGHDIEYHGTHHAHSVAYVDEHGMDAFIADEIAPDLALMRQAGYDPAVFAYPHSERRADVDAALMHTFRLLRGNAWHCD
jgi:hypothetical protein